MTLDLLEAPGVQLATAKSLLAHVKSNGVAPTAAMFNALISIAGKLQDGLRDVTLVGVQQT